MRRRSMIIRALEKSYSMLISEGDANNFAKSDL